jgi:hypothetical protein
MSGLFEFSVLLFRGDNMYTGGNVLYLEILTYFHKSKREKNMPPTIYFHKDVNYDVTNILLLLRFIE